MDGDKVKMLQAEIAYLKDMLKKANNEKEAKDQYIQSKDQYIDSLLAQLAAYETTKEAAPKEEAQTPVPLSEKTTSVMSAIPEDEERPAPAQKVYVSPQTAALEEPKKDKKAEALEKAKAEAARSEKIAKEKEEKAKALADQLEEKSKQEGYKADFPTLAPTGQVPKAAIPIKFSKDTKADPMRRMLDDKIKRNDHARIIELNWSLTLFRQGKATASPISQLDRSAFATKLAESMAAYAEKRKVPRGCEPLVGDTLVDNWEDLKIQEILHFVPDPKAVAKDGNEGYRKGFALLLFATEKDASQFEEEYENLDSRNILRIEEQPLFAKRMPPYLLDSTMKQLSSGSVTTRSVGSASDRGAVEKQREMERGAKAALDAARAKKAEVQEARRKQLEKMKNRLVLVSGIPADQWKDTTASMAYKAKLEGLVSILAKEFKPPPMDPATFTCKASYSDPNKAREGCAWIKFSPKVGDELEEDLAGWFHSGIKHLQTKGADKLPHSKMDVDNHTNQWYGFYNGR